MTNFYRLLLSENDDDDDEIGKVDFLCNIYIHPLNESAAAAQIRCCAKDTRIEKLWSFSARSTDFMPPQPDNNITLFVSAQ